MTPVWAPNLVSDRLWSDKAVCGLCSPCLLFDAVSSSPVVVWILICIHLCSTFSPLLLHVLSTKVVVYVGTISAYAIGMTPSCIRETCTAAMWWQQENTPHPSRAVIPNCIPWIPRDQQPIPIGSVDINFCNPTLKFTYFLIKGLMYCYKYLWHFFNNWWYIYFV